MILKIFNQYIPFRKLAFVFLEAVFIIGMVYLGAFLRFYWEGPAPTLDEGLFLKALIIALISQLCLYYFDLYDLKIFKSNLELAIRLLQSLGVASIVLAVLYYLYPDLIIGRGVFFISLAFMAAIIILWRLLYNGLIKTKRLDQRILIVGCGALASNIARIIEGTEDSGFKVIGFIAEDSQTLAEATEIGPVIGIQSQIVQLVEKENVERIIVALDDRRGRFPEAQLLACKLKGVEVREGIKFYENLTGKLQVENMTPSFIIFSTSFIKSKWSRGLKRVTEFAVSSVGLALLSPVLVLIPLLIKLEDGGSVFYKQERVGKDGKIFGLLKFRSMIENAEAGGPVWSEVNDPRITRIGRWIRKCRLDEIPQMLNVLKGEMSFIGPRPERPSFVDILRQKIPFYDLRISVRPGITGWAQIRYPYGASEEDALEKLKFDLYYIKNWSFFFDALILFETIKVVLFGKGAR
jgi:sugar transferase (PEP-CTERM system associated)